MTTYTGGLIKVWDEFTHKYKEEVGKKIAFNAVSMNTVVLARCNPYQKEILVTGLKE